MANIQYYDVILKPVVTEKSMELMADKKYTFLVHTEATKSQIKEAVEKMFNGTKVKSVNTMNLDGKNKRRGMTFGKPAEDNKNTDNKQEQPKDDTVSKEDKLPFTGVGIGLIMSIVVVTIAGIIMYKKVK